MNYLHFKSITPEGQTIPFSQIKAGNYFWDKETNQLAQKVNSYQVISISKDGMKGDIRDFAKTEMLTIEFVKRFN